MTDNDIINVCKESESMIVAAKNLGMTYTEFKAKALQLGCYNPNKGHSHKTTKSSMEKLQEILDGKHPTYQPFKLKNFLNMDLKKTNVKYAVYQNGMENL